MQGIVGLSAIPVICFIIHGVFLASMILFAWSERIQRHKDH